MDDKKAAHPEHKLRTNSHCPRYHLNYCLCSRSPVISTHIQPPLPGKSQSCKPLLRPKGKLSWNLWTSLKNLADYRTAHDSLTDYASAAVITFCLQLGSVIHTNSLCRVPTVFCSLWTIICATSLRHHHCQDYILIIFLLSMEGTISQR